MLRFMSEDDVRACLADTGAVIDAVTQGVLAHAAGTAKSFPTVSMSAEDAAGAIYSIRGILNPLSLASVKTVGSYPANRDLGLPPDPGLLTLIDTETGVPRLVCEASFFTTIRTAAMTALGARTLARSGARVIGCIGARGIAPLAARMISQGLDGGVIKVHSRSEATRAQTVAELLSDGFRAEVSDNWDACVARSDIVIDGAGLTEAAPLLRSDLIEPGALVISYGAYCALDDAITETADRIVLDRWDPSPTGAMGRLIGEGLMTEDRITDWFGEIVAGTAPGRRDDGERILFWHRGIGACDIALAAEAMAEADRRDLGIQLK